MKYFMEGSLLYNESSKEIVFVEEINIEGGTFKAKLLVKNGEEQDVTTKELQEYFVKDFMYLTDKNGVFEFISYNNQKVLVNFNLFDSYKSRAHNEYVLEEDSGAYYKTINFVSYKDLQIFKLAYQAFKSYFRYYVYA